ncbi:Protein of unknown function [Lutibacter oricola]|uniref:DUF3667 domain-containing protein n=1 Tax=Lutibacter oricola TaxID=762486 RepID=A0A1H2SXW0_9FLAO|nr:DUF3667 domain-containing protein [Lutibacter oricola]SDW36546.1 Protein of unknown function [Lutibacter oricola]
MKLKLPILGNSKKDIKNLECLNCGQPFSSNDKFCSYCGQKNTSKKLRFSVFISNLTSGFLSYDSRFWRTFIPLLIKPGQVSKQYIEGKRARFVNPFRFYLSVSIIFFLLLGFSNKTSENTTKTIIDTEKIDSLTSTINTQQIDSIISQTQNEINKNSKDSIKINKLVELGSIFKLSEKDDNKAEEKYTYHIKTDTIKQISIGDKLNDFFHFQKEHTKLSTTKALDSLGYKKTFWNKFYYKHLSAIRKNYNQLKNDNSERFVKKLMSHISISLFIFLPIFTMFLLLLYIRKPYTYMEHMVFVFHTQTVFFLLFIIYYSLSFIVEMENNAWVFTILFLIYLYKALRNFYNQTRKKTIIKFILLNSYYLFLSAIGFVIVFIISFATN